MLRHMVTPSPSLLLLVLSPIHWHGAVLGAANSCYRSGNAVAAECFRKAAAAPQRPGGFMEAAAAQ